MKSGCVFNLRLFFQHMGIGLFLVLSLASCSTQKNTRANRFYHAFTTRYNVYFNGITSFEEQLDAMQTGYEDNFTHLLHMHPVSAYGVPTDPQPKGDFSRALEKSQKAIRQHSMQKPPKRDRKKMNNPAYREYVKRGEFNPFIHNAWVLMGKSQFYQGDFLGALATFIYITRHFPWNSALMADARIWTARCYLELGWLYEAEDALLKVSKEYTLTGDAKQWYATVYADYLIRTGAYAEAIPYLKEALGMADGHSQKIRMTFLLAQLQAKTGDKAGAYRSYQSVIKMNPTFRTEMNARINQTEVFTGSDMSKIEKRLRRLARNYKNRDYLDQIYYALGNLYLSRGDTAKAIENYVTAAEKSTRRGVELAISQLTLGGIYFDRREYTKAQPCYAEALPLVDESYPDYENLMRRSTVLDELSVYAGNVELQDSLQRVAAMPEEERNRHIQKIIDDLIAAEEQAAEEARRAALLAEQEANAPQLDQIQQVTTPTMPGGSTSWYFYNTSLITAGKSEFQRKWGRRKLEDDWRRSNKASFSQADITEGADDEYASDDGTLVDEEAAAEADTSSYSNDPKDPRFYLQQLPFTEEAIAASNEIIADGLFNMAMILKDRLEDMEAAMANFDELDRRFPDNDYRLEAYYNCYLIGMRIGDEAMAERYKQRILAGFPDSKYAVALADPNYLDNLRRMDLVQDSLYMAAYDAYLGGENTRVHALYDYTRTTYPLSKLIPKFMLIDALSYVNEGNIDAFKTGLKALLDAYPSEDVSTLASDMLKGVAQGREVVSGAARSDIWSVRLGQTGEDGEALADTTRQEAPFVADPDVPHLLVLVYPTGSIEANLLLFNIAKYNFAHFIIRDFDLEIMSFNEISMLVVKGFYTFDEVSQYRRMLSAPDGVPMPEGVRPVMISEQNFRLLVEGHSFEEYFEFVEENQILQYEE